MNDSEKWNVTIVLSLLMIAGTLLRMFNLGFNSLWLDEAATYSLSNVPLESIWYNMAVGGEFNPPLFFVIEHVMLALGNNEVILRLMPALFGIMTIPVMYHVGKEFMDEHVGLIAAGICTFSPFLILYSQEARAYSLMLLLCAGMLYFALRGIKKNSLLDWLPFTVLAVLAVWTHFYSIVFILLLLVYIPYRLEWNIRPFFLSMAIWFALCLPIFYAVLDLIQLRTASAPTYGMQGMIVAMEIFYALSGYTVILVVILLALLAVGMFWAFTNAWDNFMLIIWLILPTLAISVVFSYFIPMLPRYLIFLSIPFYLGVAMAYKPIINLIGGGYKPAYAVLWFIVFFGMMGMPFYMSYYQNYTKEDWRGVSLELSNLTNTGDVVIAVPNYAILPLQYYYNNTADGTALEGLSTMEGLEVARRTIPNTTYYVITQDIAAVDPHMQTGTWLMQNSYIVSSYGGVTITRSLPNG